MTVSMMPLEQALIQTVEREAERLREEVIGRAVADFEKALRESVLKKAIDLTGYYDITRMGDNLILTVRHAKQP